MLIEGAIRPADAGAGFCREAWCQLIDRRPEFRRFPPKQGRNPFTGSTVTILPSRDTAEVVQGGRSVGKVYWSMSEEPLVNICVDETVMPLVLEWAAELGGMFHREWRSIISDDQE